jgi:hypothetical protein
MISHRRNTEEIQREIKKIQEFNEKENTTCQNVRDTAKTAAYSHGYIY